jgi:hypothetical protein
MTVNFSSHLFLFGGYLLELRIHNLDLFFSIINLATKKPPIKTASFDHFEKKKLPLGRKS